MILKAMGNISDADSSNINEQLLRDFMPDDIYPLRVQLVAETYGQTYQLGPKELAEIKRFWASYTQKSSLLTPLTLHTSPTPKSSRMDALSTFKYNEFLKRFDFPMNVPAKLMHHVFFPSEGTAKIETDAGWNDKGRYEMASCLWVPTKRDLHGARVCWNAGKKKMLLPGEVRDPFLIYGIYEAELKSVYEGITYFIELGLHSSFKKIVIQTDNENVVKDLRRCLLGIPMSYESNSSKDLCYNIINLLKVHGIEAEFESVPRRYNLAADAFVKELHNDSDFSNEETGFKVYSDSELKSLKVDDDLYEKLQGLDAIPGKGKREETVGLYQKYRCETNVKGDEGYTIYNTRGLAAIWFRKRKNE